MFQWRQMSSLRCPVHDDPILLCKFQDLVGCRHKIRYKHHIFPVNFINVLYIWDYNNIIYWYDKSFIIAILKLMFEKNIYKMYIIYLYTASFKKKDKWFNCKFDHNIFVYFIFYDLFRICFGCFDASLVRYSYTFKSFWMLYL